MDSNRLTCIVCRIGLPLSLTLMLVGNAFAQGDLPSLEPMLDEQAITPISDLISPGTPLPESKPAAPAKAAQPKGTGAIPVLPAEEPFAPAPAAVTPAETPAINPNPKAHKQPKNMKPVSYSPLPAIAIFPVIKHGNEKAFGDLPMIFAREYAQRLELKAPETRVYHPIYTVDEIRLRGLGHVYDQILDYYKKAGRPEPMAMDYLLKQLSGDGRVISRVIFVEADIDLTHPGESTGAWERVTHLLTDGMSKEMKYFVQSRLQVFDAEEPHFPMVWGGSWRRPVKASQFYNVTPSVYADSDSQQAFARVSRQMSREVLFATPKEVYMAPQYDTAVHGKVVSTGQRETMPNFFDTPAAGKNLSDENIRAIQRILQRQNAIAP